MAESANKTVQAGDLTIAYREAGDGPPLVLLHGGMATNADWGTRFDALARHYHVLAPDTRGHGETNNPAGRLGYDQFADDVVAFCTALGVSNPLVLGYSDGGQTGIELALRHPGFARALVLGGTISERTEDYVQSLKGWGFPAPGEADVDKLKTGYGSYFETFTGTHKGNGEPEYWRDFLNQISTLWLTLPTYSVEQLGTITAPTLVIMGDRDHMGGPEQARRLYRALPHGELAVIPNADHSASEGDLFWTIAMDFLKRQAAAI